ncbi:MAG: hypothetical protein ACJAUD_002827 [Crocinitomicaceae bacterium]|jgi:hypothetical protein
MVGKTKSIRYESEYLPQSIIKEDFRLKSDLVLIASSTIFSYLIFSRFTYLNFLTMKKLYVLATALFIGASAQAQTIDFESFGLAPNSFDNGSGGTGGYFEFLGGSVVLTNFYDTAWGGYWTDFSISNMNDVVTPGFGNQYSAYPGSGVNNSATFAALYIDGNIAVGGNLRIDSFFITNTTYAALSMLNGDAGGYGKQFGSSVSGDIHGNIPDGSNGEDFYRVWVYGEDEFGTKMDSSVVYLADYRFADNTQDYIVDNWMMVDLSAYSTTSAIASVSFKIESSDTTGGFINTPVYFAVDNISVSVLSGINENQLNNVSMYPNPATDQLMIKGEEGILTITSLTGEVLYSEDHVSFSQLDVSNYSNGVYVIKLINASGSYTNRFIKQ